MNLKVTVTATARDADLSLNCDMVSPPGLRISQCATPRHLPPLPLAHVQGIQSVCWLALKTIGTELSPILLQWRRHR